MVLLKLYNHQPLLLLRRLSFKSKGSDNIGVVTPGLPNIIGATNLNKTNANGALSPNVNTGALYKTANGSTSTGGSDGGSAIQINFDASRSNGIYGASNTVQPPALALIPQIKF